LVGRLASLSISHEKQLSLDRGQDVPTTIPSCLLSRWFQFLLIMGETRDGDAAAAAAASTICFGSEL